jgi:sugar phosphate isomerase/epimerase
MVLDHRITRRQLLKSGAGAAAAATLATMGPTVARGAAAGRAKLIPEDKVGTITFTQRDVPSRVGIAASASLNIPPTMGFLGGPDVLEDPNDLGELVPLPGGWRELFEFLAGCGFTQIEFAGYGQNAANPGGGQPNPAPGGVTTPQSRAAYLAYGRTIRGFLDEFGLEAIGNHGFIPSTWPGGPSGGMTENDFNRYMTELEFASILGTPYMGTGNDPTNANDRSTAAWDLAGEKWEALNTLGIESFGIQLYPHNHAEAYHFIQDGPPVTITEDRLTGDPIAPTQVPAESGKRLMEYYLGITSPDLCVVEMDIFWAHVAQHRFRWRYDETGARVEDIFDPLATVQAQPQRFALYHAKDGDRTTQPPGVGNGYNFVPFGDASSDIDFETFFATQGAKGFHNPNYEQDNAPGGSADPGRSLRFSKFSGNNMVNLRG